VSRPGQQCCSHSAGTAGSTQSTQPAQLDPQKALCSTEDLNCFVHYISGNIQLLGGNLLHSSKKKYYLMMEQVAQGGCGCPIPAGIQGHSGCGSGQPGLVVGHPAHSRGLELHEHCGPFQPRPFYESMMGILTKAIPLNIITKAGEAPTHT